MDYSMKYPEHFARFYDLLYHQLRDSVDHKFFLEQIKNEKGKVLDVGVGTGRFFIDALNKGADIHGIDISDSMLNVLLDKLDKKEHFRISEQNVIDFHFDFKFGLIIAPFRVMMHLLDKDDQVRALNNIFDHLENEGRFIFDVFVPDLNQLIHGIDGHTDFDGEYETGKRLKRTVSTTPDLIHQRINVHFVLEWEEEDGMKREDWKIPLRFFFRYELEHLIERSKFSQYEILGDYQGNKLNKDSREFIVICKK